MKVLGVIPARGGSKGIPRKNMVNLCGKPLIQWTIDAAKQSKLGTFIVSTDDKEIFEYCAAQNVGVIKRPSELAEDDTPMVPVVQQALKAYEGISGETYDAVMLLQPTSPLRAVEDIDDVLEFRFGTFFRCEVSVHLVPNQKKYYTQDHIMLSEDDDGLYDKRKDEDLYLRNGAIFLTSRRLLEQGRLFDECPDFLIMPKTRSIDVDDMDDLFMAEALLRAGVLSCKR